MEPAVTTAATLAECPTATAATNITTVNNVRWLDYAKNMLDTQRTVYLHSVMSDVTVVAGAARCKAHQIVLSASSDYFRSVLAAVAGAAPAGEWPMPTDGVTIIIPDLSGSLLEPLMSFIYTGETFVSPAVLTEFLEACNYLQIKGFLNYACMVNGIQLQQKQQQQQQQQEQPPQQQQTRPIVTMPIQVPASEPLASTAETVTVAVASNSTHEIYGELPIHEMDDESTYDPQFVLEAYADGGSAAEQPMVTDELDASLNSATNLTHLETFEEYLDDDDDDDDDEEDEEDEGEEFEDDDDEENNGNHNEVIIGIEDHPDARADVAWLSLDQSASFVPSAAAVTTADEHPTIDNQTTTTPETSDRPHRQRRSAAISAACLETASVSDDRPPAVGRVTKPPPIACIDPALAANQPQSARLAKTYSDASLAAAMAELQAGRSVVEVAAKFDIPRSTIYARMRCGRERVYRQYHQAKMDDAVRGVIEMGLSLKEASQRYDVSKTVLWRALKKSKVYKPEDRIQLTRADALLAIQRGETLISISKMYSIPLATLHRDKVRLYKEGKLPDHCKLRKRDVGMGYRNRLNAAVASCRNGMPQKIASEVHGVPKTTIWRHLQVARRLEANGGGGGGSCVDKEVEGEDGEEVIEDEDAEEAREEDEMAEDMYEEIADEKLYKLEGSSSADDAGGDSYVLIGDLTPNATTAVADDSVVATAENSADEQQIQYNDDQL